MNRMLVVSVAVAMSTSLVVAQVKPVKPAKPGKVLAQGHRGSPAAIYTPAQPGSQGWAPADISAARLAAKIDARLSQLSQLTFGYAIRVQLPDPNVKGGTGNAMGNGVAYVQSPTKFHIEFATVGKSKVPVSSGLIIADGKRVTTRTPSEGFVHPVPVARFDRVSKLPILEAWPTRFQELIFTGIGNSSKPLSRYVAAVSRPGSGYTVRVEQRLVRGRSSGSQYRLYVARQAASVRRYGQRTVEMVFDAGHSLPVSARTLSQPKQGIPTKLSWGVRWNLAKGQPFRSQDFVVPNI